MLGLNNKERIKKMNTKLMDKVEDFFLKHGVKFNQLDLIDTTNWFDKCIDQKKVDELEEEIERLEQRIEDLDQEHERELGDLTNERDYHINRCHELEQKIEEMGGEVE